MPKPITKKIIDYAVKSDKEVPVITPPKTDREEVLQGYTYIIKPTGYDCAMYITINNSIISGKPYEIFINCKHLDSHEWVMLATRLISEIWQTGGDVSLIISTMKNTFSPKGGYFLPKGGGFVNGVIHHIGLIIEKHIKMELPTT